MADSNRNSIVPSRSENDFSILSKGPLPPDPEELAKAQEDHEKKISKLHQSLSNWRLGVT